MLHNDMALQDQNEILGQLIAMTNSGFPGVNQPSSATSQYVLPSLFLRFKWCLIKAHTA
jgi:hypothetical protein